MWCDSVFVCVVFLVVIAIVDSFNLDTINYVRHKGQRDSMFGFSVATHRERGNSWVLVGAPEAQSELQPAEVQHGGSVYRCRVDMDDSCQEVPFDRKGDNVDNLNRVIDHKSGQWFGATLNSAGEDGPIVACAPRYVYFASKRDRRDPVGTCYVARSDFSSYSEYSPCRTSLSGYHRQGSCQAGFGAAISKDGRRLFVGGPGSWYWQGQMYSIDGHATFPFTPGKFAGAYGSGQVIQQSLETRPSVISTKEGSEKDDDSYMGYSVAVGDFTGTGEQGVAVGMPRGANLFGKIVIFTWNLTNHQNVTGGQLGAYFGYALAVGDIDGDKTDDLIIGAPLHTEANNEGKYEVGRVYLVYQGKDSSKRFRRFYTLDGFNSKSRFGLSLASLGDINLDGYGDFAVGAPYDGPNERGAVYVYHGSSEIISKYSQVIYAEDVSPLMQTFGFSIAGGVDLDQNDYPDMAVGAYLSNEAYFFRSRPVVKVDASVHFMTANKQIILDEKNCTLLNRQAVPCTSIDICMKFSGVGVPNTIELDVQYVLDSKKAKDPRMYFLSSENRYIMNETILLQKNSRPICKQKIVYIKNDIRDKLTPLEAEVRYSMQGHFQQTHMRNPRATLIPILDMNSPLIQKDSISVHKNCGPDNICIPNLRLIANPNVQRYLLGSNEKLEFDVIVQNEGEDSFESTFDLSLPPGVDFNKIIQYNKTEVRILCSSTENNTIRCDIGNPLPAGKIARFKILMTPYHKEGMRPSYDFTMVVNSTNPEQSQTISDNKVNLSIHIWVDSKLELGGTSRPADVHYNASLYTADKIERESEIGPQVIHVYSIKNNGPSGINEAEMLFLWPYATLGGEDLLYLLEQPHTLGNVKCEAAEANYRGYELEFRKKTIWETIGVDVQAGDFSSYHSSGGIIIEEGEGTSGALGGDKVHTKISESDEQTGDGSYIHQQRRKQGGGSSSTGTIVHVGEDTGSGSKVVVETHSSSWNRSYGGPVTHTYSRNRTSYTGPDGKVHYYESTQGGFGGGRQSGGQFGGTQFSSSSGSTHSSGGATSTGMHSGSGTHFSQSGGTQLSGSGTHMTGSGTHMSGSGTHMTGSGTHMTGSGTHMTGSGTHMTGSGTHQTSGSETHTSGTHTSGTHTSGGFHASGSGTHTSGSGTHISGSGGTHMTGSGTQSSESGTHITGSQAGSETHSAGTQYSQSSDSSNYGGTHGTYHPNIIYTSTGGKQHGQQSGATFAAGSTVSSSASGRIDQNHGITGHDESRQSGQTFTQESGGRTDFESGNYPGNKPQVGVNRHFDWNEEDIRRQGGSRTGGGYRHEEQWSSGQQGGGSRTSGSGGFRHEESHSQGGYANQDQTGGSRQEETHQTGTYGAGGAYPDNYDLPYSEEYYGSAENQGGYSSEHTAGGNQGYNRSQTTSWTQQGGSNTGASGRDRTTYGQYDNKNSQEDYAKHGIGGAAIGHGFHTTTLDLGTLGSGGAQHSSSGQNEISLGGAAQGSGGSHYGQSGGSYGAASEHQSGGSYGASGHQSGGSYGASGHQASSSGSYGASGHQASSSGSYGASGHSSSGSYGGGNYRGQQDNSEGQTGGQKWESKSESHWSSSGTGLPPNFQAQATMIERDNVATDKPNLQNRFHGRKRRQAFDNGDIDIRHIMECKSTKCITIRCTVGPLKKDQDATIAFRSRVNPRTLKNISTSQAISISSMMIARISKLPYIGTPLDRQIHSHEIFTSVPAPEPDIKPDIVPLWVVVLSAVAGTIILLLLIYLMYKCGFFKRNRPSDSPERQPLNRNGYYQNGDAAL